MMLWELSDDVKQLEADMALILEDESLSDEEREQELQNSFNQWLAAGESFQKKAENVARFIRHQEALVHARKAEAKRIRNLAEQAENLAHRLRHYLTHEMLRVEVKRIDGVNVKVGLRKKPARVLLKVPPEELPIEYVKVEHRPKLTEIKKLLQTDVDIDWAFLSENQDYSLTIR